MNCLRCGRTIPDGDLLCAACSGAGAAGPQPSGASVPPGMAADAFEPARIKPKPKLKQEVVLRRRIRRLQRGLAVAVCICLLLGLGGGTLWVLLRQSQTEQQTVAQQLEEARMHEDAASEALEQTRQLLNDAEEKLARQTAIIRAFEEATGITADSLTPDTENHAE